MSRFRNVQTGVVISVDDSKDDRYADGWEPADASQMKPAARKAPAKKAASKPSEK